MKPIEKLPRRHFINSFDVSEVLGWTVSYKILWATTSFYEDIRTRTLKPLRSLKGVFAKN